MRRSLTQKLHRKASAALRFLQIGGIRGATQYITFLVENVRERGRYQQWIRRFENFEDITPQLDKLGSRPLISVLVPVYNTDERWLRRCLDSVIEQIYPDWELCIADDASTRSRVREVLEEYAARDSRIKVAFREENGHISATSNSALKLATGKFTVLLDHDDELSPDALFWIAKTLNDDPETAMIYSDEDLIDASGRRFDPKFKPDFSRDLLYSTNLVTHLSAYRTDLLREIGGFRIGFEGSQDYDVALRVLERIDESRIRHIPRILYHWRTIPGSVSYSMDEKPYAHDRARRAISEHLERSGRAAEVVEAPHYLHRVRYTSPIPTISVVVSTDKKHDSVFGLVDGDREVIRVDRTDDHAKRLNEAARNAKGEVVIFLDAGLSIRTTGGLRDLASFAIQPSIGAVGGKILHKSYLVEQAGLVLRSDLSPAHAHEGYPYDAPGNLSRNLLTANYSAVSISCMAITRESFDLVGGFDAEIGDLFDVDLCLRLRSTEKRIVVAPDILLIRAGVSGWLRSSSPMHLDRLRERWPAYIERDPFCSPSLTRDGRFRLIV